MSKKRAILTVVLALIVSFLVFQAFDSAADGKVEKSASVVPYTANRAPVILIDPKVWVNRTTRRFENNKINDSHNRVLPKPVFVELMRWAKRGAVNGVVDTYRDYQRVRKVGKWLGTPMGKRHLNYVACAAPDIYSSPCMRHWVAGKHNGFVKEYTEVKIVCGGLGAIATVKKGGWIGFGLGAGGCLFGKVADRWFE